MIIYTVKREKATDHSSMSSVGIPGFHTKILGVTVEIRESKRRRNNGIGREGNRERRIGKG